MNSAHQRIAMPDGGKCKVAAACAIAGSVLLIVGTYFHPVPADPNDAVMAFTEYAADPLWIASHLAQLAGIALLLTTLIVIADLQQAVSSGFYYRVAAAGAIACLAIAAALQAIDGIALKRTVNAWSAAPIMKRDAAFYAAF
ncbi:MAG: hypothetical protein JOZ29_21835, partial [Deltaproteobacteria bacterium]|nr:hypothetical protein [Deltaproteobacteria bacterium]